MGYRPDATTRRIPAAASSGVAVIVTTTTGDVTPNAVGAASFPASATVWLDGVNYPIEGA